MRGPGIPLTVIGGYLGAGKTTLLNTLLRHPGGRRLGVIVNDFGSLPIDATLLGEITDGVVSLPNGCVCCTLGADLQAALTELTVRQEPPDQIVVEVSGVADPAATAAWGTVRPFVPGGVIVLADAEAVRTHATDRYVGGEVVRQLAGADIVLVTKIDLVSAADAAAVDGWLDGIAVDVPRIPVVHGSVPVDLVLGQRPGHIDGAGHVDPAGRADGGDPAGRADGGDPAGRAALGIESTGAPASEHGERYERWSWRGQGSVGREALDRFVDALPTALQRGKGLVRLTDGEVVSVDVVGRRREISPWYGASPSRSEFVAIGLRGTFDPDALTALADEQLAPR